MQLTVEMLASMLAQHRGATPVTLVARTVPPMRKTGNPLAGDVVKVSRVNAIIGFLYENSVNNQRLREQGEDAPLFESHPRKWGRRVLPSPLVEHTDKKGNFIRYLEVKVQKSLGYEYRSISTGTPIPDAEVECYLPKKVEGARQEVENPVILRDYDLRNILEIRMLGADYEII